MPSIRIRPSNKSYLRRLIELEVFFGIPVIALRLIFVPVDYWWAGLVILVPATVVGLAIVALVEHIIFRFIRSRQKELSKPE